MNKNLLIIHFQDYGSCPLLSSYITYVKPNGTILPGSGHCKCIICCICKTVLVTAYQLFWNFINILFVFRKWSHQLWMWKYKKFFDAPISIFYSNVVSENFSFLTIFKTFMNYFCDNI